MSKPVGNDVISFDTQAESGWLFQSHANVRGRRGMCTNLINWNWIKCNRGRPALVCIPYTCFTYRSMGILCLENNFPFEVNFVIGDGFYGHQMVEAFVEVEANVRQKHAM